MSLLTQIGAAILGALASKTPVQTAEQDVAQVLINSLSPAKQALAKQELAALECAVQQAAAAYPNDARTAQAAQLTQDLAKVVGI